MEDLRTAGRGTGDAPSGSEPDLRSLPDPRRRDVLALGLGLPLLLATQRGPRSARERAPDLRDERVLRHVVGLRPYRRGGLRIEREERSGKVLVHDYGHGGCGVTLSWGSALEALDLAADDLGRGLARAETALVLGAGAVGLATAFLLQRRGVAVRILAADLPPHTTSNVAGAMWLPTGIDRGRGAAQRARFERIVRRSWEHFEALAGDGLGVVRRRVYDAGASRSRLRQLAAVPGEKRVLERLPLPGPPQSGVRFETWLIEPPVYLAGLLERVRAAGATIERCRIGGVEELAEVPERLVFNCTGLGSRELFADGALEPVRGQLVHLEPQPLEYLYTGRGYLFPRSDAVVVGGTFEHGADRLTADPGTAKWLLANMRAVFREV